MRWLTDERRQRFDALFGRVRKFLPWISLVMGIGGAFLMDRRPEKAWMVATAVVVMWGLLGAFVVVRSLDEEALEGKKKVAAKVASFSALVGSQSLVQLCLFFALPFYWSASSFLDGHVFFFNLLVIACAVTLWDPVYEWVFEHRMASASLLAFATFAGLNCILPVMGLSNRLSLYAAAIFTSGTLPLLLRLYGLRFEEKPKRIAVDVVGVSLFPVIIAVGGGALVPPAPLELKQAAMGTQLKSKWVAEPVETLDGLPKQLVCASAIAAPRGLNDELFHVWEKDGEERDRITLKVRGGREEGFRTWSIKRHLGREPEGAWRCRIETASGQTLGSVDVAIRGSGSRSPS